MTGTGDEDFGGHAYFLAIEDIFLRLRNTATLLPPADYQVALRWHEAGIPLDLIERVLEDSFAKWKERGKERGARGKLSSLRYCAPAVEAAWAELRELTAPGERAEAPPLHIPARLRALAAALPESLPGRAEIVSRITMLAGDPPTVEEGLADLDTEMLARAGATLDDAGGAEIEAAVEKTLAGLRARLPTEELERSRERLRLQILRQRLGLPVLSLFSPEAESAG